MVEMWTRGVCATVIYTCLYSLAFLKLLGTVDASDLTIKAKKAQLEVNVGKTASLIWSYNTGGQQYDAILWGKADKQGINFQAIYYAKTPDESSPVKSKDLDSSLSPRVKISDGSSLVISDAKLSDEGFYLCEIRTQFVTVKEKIFLRVYDPAKIVTHPPPLLEYNEGRQEKVVCKAKGKPRPEVQWFKNGKLVAKRKGKLEIPFNPVTDDDMAQYKCLAVNKGGKAEVYTNITVFFKPKATTFKTDASANTVSLGTRVNFMCQAKGYPKPEYKFFIRRKGKKEIPLGYRDAERSGKISNVVVVDNTFYGTYICIPYNKHGQGPRSEVTLYVRYPPRLTRPPRDVTVRENDFVAVQCLADGYPKPTITWIKLTGNEVKSYGTSFNIPSVSREDQGDYQCVADNKNGKPAIGPFTINVLYPPVINRTASSVRVAAWKGYNATLLCVADGNPQPKYKWINSSGPVAESEVDGTLKITPTDDSAFGDYTCEAFNSRGRDSHTVTVIKVDRPGPINVAILVKTKDSIRFQWTVLDNGQSEITHFTVKWRKKGTNAWNIETLQAYESDYELKKLNAYTSYQIRVLASNKYFTSLPKDIYGRTIEAEPTKPYDVIGFPVNRSSISINWREPRKKNSKRLGGYTVFYCRRQDCVELVNRMPRVSVAHNFTWTVIGGLQAFSNYTVKVRAFNDAGWADSDPILVTTKMAAPSIPEDFKVNSSGFSVTLKWNRPRLLNGHVAKFRIMLRWRLRDLSIYNDEIIDVPASLSTIAQVKRKRRSNKLKVKRKRRSTRKALTVRVRKLRPYREISISGLRPYSMYILSVAEGTGNGHSGVLWGPYSSQELLSMPQGAPSPPEKVEAFSVGLSTIKVSWEKPSFPNGKIRQYAIVYSNTSGINYTLIVRKDIKNEAFKYEITGLRPFTPYRVTVRAYTIYPGPYSEPVFVTTGSKASVSDTARRESEVDSGSLFGGVFAGIILFAFVIIIVVLIVRNRRRKRDSTELKGNRYGVANSNDSGIGEKESLDNVPGVKFLHSGRRGSEEVIGPGRFATLRPIPLNKLYDYCRLNHANNNKLFREEFISIRPAELSSEISIRDNNRPKNRYQNILAYDHTRVILSEIEGVNSSNYINANFVDGYNCPKKFIGTQGPVSNTFDDFWRMIWEYSCTAVVMVTNIVERGKVKCLKYWPSASPEEYGSFVVTPLEEEELSHYVIRKFTIAMNDNEEQPPRQVVQYHYTAWPDHGVPSHATSLLAFIRRVRASIGGDPGPIVVHCSAGVGRTGTYIVLDAMMDQMASECVVDPYGFVNHIRQQRNLMVQTEAQYIFLYDALLEAIKCGSTEFKVQELHEKLKQLLSIDPQTGEPIMVEEFKNLDIGDTEADTFDAASLLENKSKNRHAILPYDRTRVKLWPYAGVIGSDYINASFIDSYQQREAFLATQSPLQSTLGELWRMIWEYESYSLVMLNQDIENDKGQSYLPNKGEFVVYGLLMVEIESREDKDGYSKRLLKVTNTKSGEVRKVFHFQFYNWEESGVPKDGKMLIDMLKHIARAQQQTGNGPMTVHCSDGSGRTGTFCAISIALERVKLDGTIDMFQTVRNLRTQRPLMVQTEEQYKFCYDVVRLFVEAYNDYANFK